MTRVFVVVEGQTEEAFVKQVLAPSFWPRGTYLIPILLGKTGGRPAYVRVQKHVITQLKQDRVSFCSTMLDMYGLGTGFPGTPIPANLRGGEKAVHLEGAMKQDIVTGSPNDLRAELRFLPYLQVHEFEALLFSNPVAFGSGITQPHLSRQFQAIRDSFPTPEDINDDPNTAPSKRIQRAYPRYSKVVDGTLAAVAIGLARMRQECPHFRSWLQQIEALGD